MWTPSSSSDPRALALVDGTGRWEGHGPHYSRRTPGSRTFVGAGRQLVLVTEEGDAVWSVIYQRTPAPVGSGSSRGRTGETADRPYLWRNNLFRRMPGAPLASDLIREATKTTYGWWLDIYRELPDVRLRTEVRLQGSNPGYCYQVAGWERAGLTVGHNAKKRILYAPAPTPGDVVGSYYPLFRRP